jgi:hypothetical protein
MRTALFLTAFSLIPLLLCSQDHLLQKKLSISLQGETIEASLKKISTAGGFVFSYNPAIIDGKKRITHRFTNQSIREILDKIFEGTVEYKSRGKYIILTSAPKSSARKEPAVVSGYIVDEATGERLKDVSVYDPITLSSAITDSEGYFQIKIDKPAPDIILSVNRQNYTDTIVAVNERGRLLNISLKIDKEKIVVLADSVSDKIQRLWEKRTRLFQNANMMNVDDTLYRVSQVSLVPFIGTNHKMSAHVINDLSLNVIGGYSLGVNTLEIGGVFNLVRGNVKGAQFAGVFNGVGGDMTGAQFAGIMNANVGWSRGAQFAGVLNINSYKTDGAMISGVANIATEELRGPQFAGVFNIATESASVAQLGGVFNVVARDMRGFQAAGVFNIAGGNVKGAQVGGVFNIAGKDMKGIQIAPVFNVANKMKGVQIGLINIADSLKGVPIGFMSLVWRGYHKIEISADEIFYNNLAFRTGVNQFYNIFTIGARPSTYKDDVTLWSFGYGIGTAPRLSRKLYLNFDLTANQIVEGKSIEALNLLNRVYVGFDYQMFPKMSLTFGATVNGHITENSFDAYPQLFEHYEPNIFLDRDFGSDHNLKMWMGAKVGLRFL